MNVIDLLANFPVREFEDRDHGEAHHLKARQEGKTDALHEPLHNVLKRRLYDI
jgi:hypothetical protein